MHGTDERLTSFFTAKLQLISPCEDCFLALSQVLLHCRGSVYRLPRPPMPFMLHARSACVPRSTPSAKPQTLNTNPLRQAPGFVCAQFIDLAEPGDILLDYWTGTKLPAAAATDPRHRSVIAMLKDRCGSVSAVAESASPSLAVNITWATV